MSDFKKLLKQALDTASSQGIDTQSPAGEVLQKLVGASENAGASSENGYQAALAVLQAHQVQLQVVESVLEETMAALAKAAESNQPQISNLTANNWPEYHQLLLKKFEQDAEAGVNEWLAMYASALTAWELDVCHSLVQEEFPFPASFAPQKFLFRFGTMSIRSGEYQEALNMLVYLANTALAQPQMASLSECRAMVYIFIGRIYLFREKDFTLSRFNFKDAEGLLPQDGRISAVWGHYNRLLEDGDDEASSRINNYFQDAIEKSPGQPDGYVGLGMMAENHSWWSEAHDWYRQAFEAVSPDVKLDVALKKLLAPTTGNLLFKLADYLHHHDDLTAALETVNEAIEAGLNDGSRYPNRSALRLKGQILEQLATTEIDSDDQNSLSVVAEIYLEAGHQYYWLNDFETAANLFKDSIRADATDPDPYFYLADSLRIESNQKEFPYVNADIARSAHKNWEAGMALEPKIDEDSAWYYLARDSIENQLAQLPDEDNMLHWWQGALFTEQAILYGRDARRLSRLAGFYRSVDATWNALLLMEQAVNDFDRQSLSQDNRILLLQEYSGALINIGKFDDVVALLDEILAEDSLTSDSAAYYKGWKALVYHYQGDFEKSLELIQANIKRDKQEADIWSRRVRADISRILANDEAADADDEWVWARRERPEFNHYGLDFGASGFELGHYDEALAIYRNLLIEDPTQKRSIMRGIAFCLLVMGQITADDTDNGDNAADILRDYVEETAVPRELMGLKIDLHSLIDASKRQNKAITPRIEAFVEDFLPVLEEKQNSLEAKFEDPVQAAIDEFEYLLTQEGLPAIVPATSRVGLGRLYTQAEAWDKASDIYGWLKENGRAFGFREWFKGISILAESTAFEATKAVHQEDYSTAMTMLDYGLALAEQYSTLETLGDIQALRGAILIWQNNVDAAADLFIQSLDFFQEKEGNRWPGKTLGKICLDFISQPTQYWALKDYWLTAWKQSPYLIDFQDAAQVLDGFLGDYFQLTADTSNLMSVVTPVAIEVGRDLIPQVPDNEWIVLQEYIPEMRERIQAETGVRVPGIRFRGNETDIPSNRYLIMLEEVPRVMHTLNMTRTFVTASVDELLALTLPPTAIEETFDPAYLGPAVYLDNRYLTFVRQAELTVLEDPQQVMIRHLEAMLRVNLDLFLSDQDVANMLESWQSTSEVTEDIILEINRLQNDTERRLRFGRLLRALVQEWVSIANWKTILTNSKIHLEVDNIDQALVDVRLALKANLPGNQLNDERRLLPQNLEEWFFEWLERDGDKQFLAADPQSVQSWLNQFQDWLGEINSPNVVLQVRDSGLRPYIHKLIHIEYPRLMVIAEAETI